MKSSLQNGMASCHTCLKVSSATLHVCDRCGTPLHARKENSIEKTIAFGIAGILAFIPANLLPIMNVTQLGVDERSTIVGGVATFGKCMPTRWR